MAYMPEVVVAAIGIGLLHRHWNMMRFEVRDLFFPALNIPDAPWSNHFHLRSKGLDSELEAHLVVAFAGTAMRHCICAFGERHFSETFGKEWPRCARTKQVFFFVRSTCLDECPEVLLHKLFFLIELDKLRGSRSKGSSTDPIEISLLPNITTDCYHLAVIMFFKPGYYHSSIQSTGISKDDFLFHKSISPLNEYVNHNRA